MLDTLLSISTVPDSEGRLSQIIAHVVDLTERKNLEQELHRTERLTTVGRLAGGVVHDFNNLLTVIAGVFPILTDGEMAARKVAVAQVESAAWAGARLTKQLMAFSSKGVVEAQNVDTNLAIKRLQAVLKATMGPNSTLRLDLTDSPTVIRIDPVQLEQVIMSLSFNAIQAMPDGGGLTIRTRQVADNASASIVVEFEDTGTGMSREVCDQAFEPFYTNRKSGGGTGLGLSTVHGIVVRFGGQIELHSTLGVGTRCRIFWPVAESAEFAPQPTGSRREELASLQSARILVVDDHEAILEIISEVLIQAGYQVVQAGSVAQGAEAITNAVSPFDMVISDVELPDGSGSDIVAKARALWPSTRRLYISGYTAGILSQLDVASDKNSFLQKPFHPTQLLERVRAIFEEASL